LIIRVAPLLAIILTLGYFAFAGREGEMPGAGPHGGAGGSASASSSLVVVATLTPAPGQADTRLASLGAGPASSTLPAPTPTPTPELDPSATPEAEATETEVAVAETPVDTETPVPTETPTPTETSTPDPSATATETPTPTDTATPTATATPQTPTVVPLPGLSSGETQILLDHNSLRDSLDLDEFRLSDTLMEIARERAAAMASMQSMTHYNPDGSTVFDMMYERDYDYVTGSENIHYNYGYSDQQSVRVAVEGWIDSPDHYASMINPALGRIGIGIATGANGRTYYSVVFSD
jgi:uncharacterized protein YkwD